MRTRRSVRNQNILWRELGGATAREVRDELDVLRACLAKASRPRDRRHFERAIEREEQRRRVAAALAKESR